MNLWLHTEDVHVMQLVTAHEKGPWARMPTFKSQLHILLRHAIRQATQSAVSSSIPTSEIVMIKWVNACKALGPVSGIQ